MKYSKNHKNIKTKWEKRRKISLMVYNQSVQQNNLQALRWNKNLNNNKVAKIIKIMADVF